LPRSWVDFIARAKALGYQVIMVLIHLESTGLNQARIAGRVSEGGHGVPADKVISRIPRLLDQVRTSIPLVDVLRVYDNSSAVDPFVPVFTITNCSLRMHQVPLSPWAAALLSGTQATLSTDIEN
jgi:predicted ABC-type ATPase